MQPVAVAASDCKWLLGQVAACSCKWLLGEVAASGCKSLQVAASGRCKWLLGQAGSGSHLPKQPLAAKLPICKWLYDKWLQQVAASGCMSKWLQVIAFFKNQNDARLLALCSLGFVWHHEPSRSVGPFRLPKAGTECTHLSINASMIFYVEFE